MATAQEICTYSLSQILNDDATQTPSATDLNFSLTTLQYLLDHLELDPQTTIGLKELIFTPQLGYQTITIAAGISTTLTSVGTTATATTASPHYRAVGDRVVISGANQTEYNGAVTIVTAPTATTFTYTFAGSATTPATGTILTSGDINAPMPPRLETSSFQRLSGLDIPIIFAASFEEYTRQPVKSNQGWAMKYFYMPQNTNVGTLYLWPASNGAELHLWARTDPLVNYSTMTLATTLTLPPGVQKVLIDILAAELLNSFNVPEPVHSRILQKGNNSLRKWKRMNLKIAQLTMPRGIGDGLRTMFTT